MAFLEIHDAEQQQQMLELLREGFPKVTFDWAVALKAPASRAGRGLLLIEDGEPQGCILAFEKTETVGGRERRFVNLSSWYIRPAYRRMAVRMMRAASSDPDAVYTICTPIRSVQAICRRVGFRYLTHGSIASVPFLNGLIAGRGITVEPFDPTLVDPEQRQRMIDHADPRLVSMTIRQGERTVPVLLMRGLKMKELPAARLLFATDYELLRAALPAVHQYLLRRHGIIGLYLPRIGPLAGLRSLRKPNKGPSTIVKGDIADTDVNLLYSELLYLPLGGRQRANASPAGAKVAP
jgi:hypothetical protein